ncbi:hypothetical protein [Hufsiella ginkgonis]|uniref:Uncharacterized protein n=1 Tax=Hufsiella ginkgonis TaxID=2695274 RepID=A0A7K1XX87_9SPHI|nr:hypothetical protein [Hufsiella ginkgonis]MXV15447.1 hypothetical protein [Hufsiella ginkgonis]
MDLIHAEIEPANENDLAFVRKGHRDKDKLRRLNVMVKPQALIVHPESPDHALTGLVSIC